MDMLTTDHFQKWMQAYGKASKGNDPKASADLFAGNAKYYESPFAEPMIGREAIFQYWDNGARKFMDKESAFEILAVIGSLGIARWQSSFTVIESRKSFTLDCVFVVDFDDKGLCQTFREWWHIQESSVVGGSCPTST